MIIGYKEGYMGKISEADLKRIIKGGETNTVELKIAAPRATEMAERLCGMANAQGGIVIIGVKDSTHEVVGVPDHNIGETLDVILRATRKMLQPELVLDPSEPEIYTIAGKNVIVATVRPSNGPVYQAHGIYWIRRGTHTVSLSLSELLEVANNRGLLDWEHQPVHNATMDDIDLEKVKAYLAQRSAQTRQASRFENIENVLIGMRCAVLSSDGSMVPTNAGLLFFGHHPQEHIVQTDVACVLFRETVGASRYADRRIVTFHKAPALVSRRPQQELPYAETLWGDEVHPSSEMLSQSQTDKRERRLTEALDYVHKHGFITNSIYRQLTGVTDRTAHRDLETLIERGRLKGTGQKAARRYVLA